jgi:VanZ family protein
MTCRDRGYFGGGVWKEFIPSVALGATDASPGENGRDMDDRPLVIDTMDRSSAADEGASPGDARRRFLGVAVAVYWTTLLIATHVPVPGSTDSIPGADKAAHFVGYGVLGLLVTLWIALRRRLRVHHLLLIIVGLAAYAALDELLQVPVGRTCDLADWMWDVIGSCVGALLIALVSRLHTSR